MKFVLKLLAAVSLLMISNTHNHVEASEYQGNYSWYLVLGHFSIFFLPDFYLKIDIQLNYVSDRFPLIFESATNIKFV